MGTGLNPQLVAGGESVGRATITEHIVGNAGAFWWVVAGPEPTANVLPSTISSVVVDDVGISDSKVNSSRAHVYMHHRTLSGTSGASFEFFLTR